MNTPENVPGFPLYRDDLITTEPGTVVKLQLLPGEGSVIAGENTSFRMPAGDRGLQLLYGRLKVVCREGSSADDAYFSELPVRASGYAEFCLDQFVDTAGRTRSQVLVISGEVSVRDEAGGTTHLLGAGKGLAFRSFLEQDAPGTGAAAGGAADAAGVDTTEPSRYWNRRQADAPVLALPWQEGFRKESPSFPADGSDLQRLVRLAQMLLARTPAVPADAGPVALPEMPASLADSLPVLTVPDPAVLFGKNVGIRAPDPFKSTGLLMTLGGCALDVLAISVMHYGTMVLALDQATCDMAGMVIGIGGIALTGSGVVVYSAGLFN